MCSDEAALYVASELCGLSACCCRRRWQPALHLNISNSSQTNPRPCCLLQVQDPSLLRFLVDLRDADIDDKQLRDDLMTMLIAGHCADLGAV